jgi:transposase
MFSGRLLWTHIHLPGCCRLPNMSEKYRLSAFAVMVGKPRDLLEGRRELAAAVEPLLGALEGGGRQIVELDSKVRRLAKASEPVRRLMTTPGVGPITALCYLATVDDPSRLTARVMSAPISA